MILYSCETFSKNINELTSTTPSASLEMAVEPTSKTLDENDNYQSDQDDDNCNIEFRVPEVDSIKDTTTNPIKELFNHIFVNDSLTCFTPIKKLYYSAKIYPNICYLCGSFKIPIVEALP
ncbi:hypothetical protein C2G38_2240023 [Gigaspora rosea]|uniref:Uncharacterized protein n=1 Tax=Gigaspora rosea TaxID=44941 RepID=A0A397W5P4_9GLOM|nr:hypothetical protein C2G38_2240023 [Gigaspora rosea]